MTTFANGARTCELTGARALVAGGSRGIGAAVVRQLLDAGPGCSPRPDRRRARRAPQKLLTKAISGYLANVVSAQALAALRGIDVDTLDNELTAAGLRPVDLPVAWADAAALPDVDVDVSALTDDAFEGSAE
jgi:NAD(P)-dependent dehydrogenase (short-subunit alcohol dehydrogenase family)